MKKVITIVVSLILAVCLVGVFISVTAYFNDDMFETNFDAYDFNLDYNSMVYYTDNQGNDVEFDQISGSVNRIWADIDDIAVDVQDAFVAIEDERFWQHSGFDLKRLVGATVNYVIFRKSDYGGSTITQQWVKNVTKDDGVNAGRKIREILRAIKVENEFTKEEILELYLNTIYLSHGCNGVQSASHMYFGKDVSELNLAESACLAGITQLPSKYDPIDNPEENYKKRCIILDKMLELGMIDEDECQEAKDYEIQFNINADAETADGEKINSYFVEAVIEEVLKDLQKEKGYSANYAAKLLYNGGLQIYTTYDPNIQYAIETVFQNEDNFSKSSYTEVQPQSAMVIMDPYTGAIKGLYGGRGVKKANLTLNRATNTLRSPGSTIKPIAVYTPAVEEGLIGSASIINDNKITISGWTPHNYDYRYHGRMTIRTALENSYNIPAIKVLQLIGVNKSYDFMTKNLGFTSLVSSRTEDNGKVTTDKALAALALGGLTDGVSVKEMCAAYSTFPNEGVYTTPYTYTKILDHDGNLLLEKNIRTSRAYSKETASIMTHMMQGVVTRGTGTAARLSNGMPAAGKTGTSENTTDLWFCGYTPYYCGAVWYGYDIPDDMAGFTSGGISASLWKKVMDQLHEGLDYTEFKRYDNVNYYKSVVIPGQGSIEDDEKEKEDKEKEEKEETEEGTDEENSTPPDGEIDGNGETVPENPDTPEAGDESEAPSEEVPVAPSEETVPADDGFLNVTIE